MSTPPPGENSEFTTAPGTRVAAFFDLDKTIIASSSTLAFSRPFFAEGLINRRAVLKSSYAQLLFLLTAADADQVDRLRRHVTQMCAGWDVEQVRATVHETLHDVVEPLVFAEARDLIASHHARGHDVVIVSASGSELVEPIGEMVGADLSMATRMEIADGRYTGELEFYCYGQNKVAAIADLAAARGYDLARCFAYSDSVTDEPMLSAVGHPAAVNPDRALRKSATENGWPVLTFTRAVSVSRRRRPSTLTAVAAIGAAAVVAGAVTFAVTHRD